MKSFDVSCRDCANWNETDRKCKRGMVGKFIRWVADECQFFDGKHKTALDKDY